MKLDTVIHGNYDINIYIGDPSIDPNPINITFLYRNLNREEDISIYFYSKCVDNFKTTDSILCIDCNLKSKYITEIDIVTHCLLNKNHNENKYNVTRSIDGLPTFKIKEFLYSDSDNYLKSKFLGYNLYGNNLEIQFTKNDIVYSVKANEHLEFLFDNNNELKSIILILSDVDTQNLRLWF